MNRLQSLFQCVCFSTVKTINAHFQSSEHEAQTHTHTIEHYIQPTLSKHNTHNTQFNYVDMGWMQNWNPLTEVFINIFRGLMLSCIEIIDIFRTHSIIFIPSRSLVDESFVLNERCSFPKKKHTYVESASTAVIKPQHPITREKYANEHFQNILITTFASY